MEHKRQIAKENNEGLLPLSYIETLQINLHGLTDTDILHAIQMEVNFIREFEIDREDYLERLEIAMELYSETRQKDILNLIF